MVVSSECLYTSHSISVCIAVSRIMNSVHQRELFVKGRPIPKNNIFPPLCSNRGNVGLIRAVFAVCLSDQSREHVHNVRPPWLCACASGGKACVLVHVCTGRHMRYCGYVGLLCRSKRIVIVIMYRGKSCCKLSTVNGSYLSHNYRHAIQTFIDNVCR